MCSVMKVRRALRFIVFVYNKNFGNAVGGVLGACCRAFRQLCFAGDPCGAGQAFSRGWRGRVSSILAISGGSLLHYVIVECFDIS